MENQELRDKLNDPNFQPMNGLTSMPNGYFNRDLEYLTTTSPLMNNDFSPLGTS